MRTNKFEAALAAIIVGTLFYSAVITAVVTTKQHCTPSTETKQLTLELFPEELNKQQAKAYADLVEVWGEVK